MQVVHDNFAALSLQISQRQKCRHQHSGIKELVGGYRVLVDYRKEGNWVVEQVQE